jgi:hypothetical protein
MAKKISDFQLTNYGAANFSNDSTKGKWSLFFFGYTRCPDVCPTELQIATALMLLLIVGLGAYEYLSTHSSDKVRLPLVGGCKLNLQACSAELPTGGKVIFKITPRPPNPEEVIHLSATFHQLKPQSVRVLFEGRDMYMGYLEFGLAQKKFTGDSVEFAGNGGVFVCSYGIMPWVVLVNVQVDGRVYEIPFEFETIYNRP